MMAGGGGGQEIIYMYGQHTAISFHSWYFLVLLRSSHYAVAFAGILVVSQKKNLSFFSKPPLGNRRILE